MPIILKEGKLTPPPKPEKMKKTKCPHCKSVIGYLKSELTPADEYDTTYLDRRRRIITPLATTCPFCHNEFWVNGNKVKYSEYVD